ncbi:MAG: Crp/Fnr family transcriptional regulator [Candidatus Anammoximicrobium sp.]|nr:Crp/Fnr family transcriptional regulator [Candidatus Anammoximicrobium sp.]
MQETADEILKNCHFFAQVDRQRIERLAQLAQLRRFSKGQLIFRQGEACPGVYMVGSGMVRVFKIAPSGKEHVLHILGPGNTFAEVAAIGGFNCPANAEAVADSTCVLIPLDLFRKAMSEDHQLCLQMMTGLTFWVRHFLSLMEDIVLRDAAGRLARFLLEAEPDGDGTVRMPTLKRHVASHLNLTSETFSRTLSRLIEAGLIVELDNNRVQLREPDRLRLVADGFFPQI